MIVVIECEQLPNHVFRSGFVISTVVLVFVFVFVCILNRILVSVNNIVMLHNCTMLYTLALYDVYDSLDPEQPFSLAENCAGLLQQLLNNLRLHKLHQLACIDDEVCAVEDCLTILASSNRCTRLALYYIVPLLTNYCFLSTQQLILCELTSLLCAP